LRINYVGIIASAIAFSSLLFPWWTLRMSIPSGVTELAEERISVYPYQVATETVVLDFPDSVPMNLWFGWVAFVLIVAAGAVGIIGSFLAGKIGKTILLASGILSVLSIAVFATGIQIELTKASPIVGFPVNLFTTSTSLGITSSYYYLDIGFWVALIGAILAFVSILSDRIQKLSKKPES
jgi:hypothetical protein